MAGVTTAALVAGLASVVHAPLAVAAAPSSAPTQQAGPDEAADLSSARVTARLRNRRIEAVSERTEASATWVNPDGSRTTELNVGPVRVRRGDAWVPVDLTLVKAADGTVRPKAHPRDLVLAGPGGSGSTTRDLAAVSTTEGQVGLQWTGSLPDPVLSGDTATYRDVQPGIDLQVKATRTGFEQFLVLKRKPAKGTKFTLPVRAAGLTTRTDADGNTDLIGKNGAVVGSVPAAEMWDSRTDRASGGPARKVKVAQRTQTKNKGNNAPAGTPGDQVDVTLEPETSFLDDSATQYPVIVDPGVTVWTNFDTFTQSGTTTDQSGSPELRIGTWNGGANVARSYLHFDMSAFRGTRILGSTLWLYATHSYSCNARWWEVWSTPLVGTGTRWSNQPAPWNVWSSNVTTSGYSGGCPANWVSTDIRTLQQAWADQGFTNAGMMLKALNESDSYGWKKFSSAEGGAVPHIDVTYNTPPNPTTGLNVSDRGDSGGVTYTRSTTPLLTFRPSDPDGEAVRAFVYVYEGETMITHA
ncbi:MAG TPA: DNRLRE domain-containing protein, partial [Actinophytocola sp.]|nr:DNRLRE domain-containing protein [Actinophytocola sp.]